jgi:DNA-directed RNA polymerase subunit RPC12/RpoP
MPNTNCLEGIRCPKCGHEDAFKIEAKVLVELRADA